MKKFLFSLAALAMCASAINAQQRFVLFEEFTGENCGPCAATNPGLWTLMSANTSKAIMIKYMSPIPSAGQFYYQDKPVTDNRITYYSVPFAPYGRMDGMVKHQTMSSPGHPGYLVQADIDSNYAVASPFNITATAAWNSTYDSVVTTIQVHAVSAYAPTSGTVSLRVALTETVDWATPPGNNGEKNFENVVRAMYPDANGTPISASWTSGTTTNYTIRGAVPSYVDKSGSPFMVVWVQNDLSPVPTHMTVAQAAKSSALPGVPTDMSVTMGSLNDICGPNGTTTSATLTLKNVGSTNTLTAATIYTKIDNGSWASQPWTGSLAVGATTTVTINGLALSGAGSHIIYDSIDVAGDENLGNNSTSGSLWFQANGNALPISSGFEAPTYLPSTWHAIPNSNGDQWNDVWSGSSTTNIGYNGSVYAEYISNPGITAGESMLLAMPTPTMSGQTALDFYVAYAQQATSNTDALDVVYSADCGATWTSIWNKSGANLATAPVSPITNTSTCAGCFLPTTNSEWAFHSLDVSAVPANAIIAFKETAGGGNFLFLDNVNLRAGAPSGVETVTAATINATVYPNPAKDQATLTFSLAKESDVQIELIDALGRVVNTIANQKMSAGGQNIEIRTAEYAAGIYNVVMHIDGTVITQRLTVSK